jgi:hypothetical protein
MKPIWYSSDELNAPTLNNAAGSLIAVFDAILVNGFNLKSVSSITIAAGVATVSCTGHQFTTGRRVQIAGASISALNDNHEISVVDANTFTFQTTASGAVSGTITAKRPSLGWSKSFTGTNTAMYERPSAQATDMLLRVEDIAASVYYARAFGVESASAVSIYTGQFPTQTQFPDGLLISKGGNSTTVKRWLAVGDERTLYFFSDDANYYFAGYGGLHTFLFGDVASWRSGGDAFGCFIGGGRGQNGANYVHNSGYPSADTGLFLCRPTNHIGSSVRASLWAGGQSQIGSDLSSGGVYPSPVDNGMPLNRAVMLREDNGPASHPYRGVSRGLAAPLAALSTSGVIGSLHGTVISEWLGTTDKFLCVGVVGQGDRGMLLFNVSSEWPA